MPTIVLCCDTTVHSSGLFQFNLHRMLLVCILIARVLQRVLNDSINMVDTGGHQVPPILQPV